MTTTPWNDVKVVVYTSQGSVPIRMEETLRLPREAGFPELLAALAFSAPDIHREVLRCLARGIGCLPDEPAGGPVLAALDRQFVRGGPVLLPDLPDERAVFADLGACVS
ncbi:MAG: hypothetical protein PHV11_07800 [Candidatus Bipolaricaulis sp.]|nr:hypothetical protein [Candidatus Bipolaricaulis sp.]MDD5646530.1 hypothetical protein [Candidatus Bipolaricaulis sp.]